MKQSLPGIIAISYIECKNLPADMELRTLSGLSVGIYEPVAEVAFIGTPTCITESAYDMKSQSERTTLTFQTTVDLPIRRNLAFVITDVQENNYVIGHAEDPFPTIKRNRNLGTPADNKAVYTYEVVLIGRKTLIETSM